MRWIFHLNVADRDSSNSFFSSVNKIRQLWARLAPDFSSFQAFYWLIVSVFIFCSRRRCLFTPSQRTRRQWFSRSPAIETNECWSLRQWSDEVMFRSMWTWSQLNRLNQSNHQLSHSSLLNPERSNQMICRSISNVIWRFCERITRRRCVRIAKEPKLSKIWISLYWRQW